MKLGVLDRIALLNTLPQRGDFLAMTMAAEIRDKVKFSAAELGAIEFKRSDDGLEWNDAKEKPLEVDLTQGERDMIRGQLAEMNATNKLTPDHIGIYRRFVLSAEEVAKSAEAA